MKILATLCGVIGLLFAPQANATSVTTHEDTDTRLDFSVDWEVFTEDEVGVFGVDSVVVLEVLGSLDIFVDSVAPGAYNVFHVSLDSNRVFSALGGSFGGTQSFIDEDGFGGRFIYGAAIQAEPIVRSQSTSQTVISGHDVELRVSAEGIPPLSYQWTHDGANIPGATEPTLALTGVVLTDAGEYRVRVTNPIGSITSDPILLEVEDNEPPTIESCAPARTIPARDDCFAPLPNLTNQVTAIDNGGPVNITQFPAPGALVGLGDTTVEFTVTDLSDNTATCTTTVTVEDDTPPFVPWECRMGEILDAGPGCSVELPDFAAFCKAIGISDCNGPVTVSQSPPPGTIIVGLGGIRVVLTATDAASNSNRWEIRVNIEDWSPPIITSCPTDRMILPPSGVVPDVTSLVEAYDYCTPTHLLDIWQLPLPGTVLGPGEDTISVEVVDERGNSETCHISVSPIQCQIEITQAIQDTNNSLPLVENKTTVARVFAKAAARSIANPVTVELFASREGNRLPESLTNQHFQIHKTYNREQLGDSVNFLLPPNWLHGTVQFHVEIKDSLGHLHSCTDEVTITFIKTKNPVIWIVPINLGTQTKPSLVSTTEIAKQELYMKVVFPAADVTFDRLPWHRVIITNVAGLDPEKLEERLNEFYKSAKAAWSKAKTNSAVEPRPLPDQIYGFTPSRLTRVTSDGQTNLVVASSNPIWYPPGRGHVAWGWGFRGVAGESIMAHEINHNLDLSTNGTWGRHAGNTNEETWGTTNANRDFNWGCGASGCDTNWPWTNDYIQEVGFDTRTPVTRTNVVPGICPDFMSYCQSGTLPTKWISTYRWTNLLNHLAKLLPDVSAAGEQIQEVYYISGQLESEGRGSLKPVLVHVGLPTGPVPRGDYAIALLNGAGAPLLTWPFLVRFEDEYGYPLDTVYFNYELPAQAGTARIILRHGQQILHEIVVSPQNPTVTLLSPNGGETWSGEEHITWQAEDADSDELTFRLFYTPDDGQSWVPVSAGPVQGTSYKVDSSMLPGGEQARISIVVTDGFNTTSDESDGTFTVPRKAPDVFIINPLPDEACLSGQTVIFQAEATDLEDTSLPDSAYVWYFGTNVFGIGRNVRAELPDGTHQVSVTVTDSDGMTSEAGVETRIEFLIAATVVEENEVRLSFPARGGQPYTVYYRDSLEGGVWQVLRAIAPLAQSQMLQVVDDWEAGTPMRFYQISTP